MKKDKKQKIALVLALACFTSSAFGEEWAIFGAWLWRTRRKTKYQKHQTA